MTIVLKEKGLTVNGQWYAPGSVIVGLDPDKEAAMIAGGNATPGTGPVDGGGSLSYELPVALGWDSASWPVSLRVDTQDKNYPKGDAGLTLRQALALAHPTWGTWQAIYVDTTLASGGAGTEASPFATIGAARNVANISGNPARIFVKGGTTTLRAKGFDGGGNFSQLVDVVYIAYNGRCAVTTSDALTWSLDGTYTNCYTAARSSTVGVVDLLARTANATYPRLRKVSTQAICNRTPGSWWTDNVSVLVNRADGEPVVDSNTRAYLGSTVNNLVVSGTSQKTCALLAATTTDGWDLEGGQVGAMVASYTGNAGSRKTVFGAEKSTFRYSGGVSGAIGNVAAEGVNGLVIFDGCMGDDAATDMFNWHNVLGSDMYVLTVNCAGSRSGQLAGYLSCNGSTAHDDKIRRISLCDRHTAARGATIHDIGNCRSFIASPAVGGSLGDIANGGVIQPTEVRAHNTTVMWLLDPVWLGEPSGFPRVVVGETATLYYRGIQASEIRASASATILPYA